MTLDGGVADGWVAIADHDGTPWIELSEAPSAGINVAEASVKLQAPSLADARRVASELNAFGISLYKRMLAVPQVDLDGKGVAMSPTSIAMALAMARAGADGSTASQMDHVLRANGWNGLGSGLGSLEQVLNGHNATWKDDEGTSHSLSLNVVNRAFGQDGWPIEQAYLQRIGRAFGAGIGLVDYMRDSSAARDLINGWVARQTANRIPKLLSPTDVTSHDAPRARERHLPEGRMGGASSKRGRGITRPFTTAGGTTFASRRWTARRAGRSRWRPARGGGPGSSVQRRRRVRQALAMTLIRPDNLAAFQRGLAGGRLDRVARPGLAGEGIDRGRSRTGTGTGTAPGNAYTAACSLPKFGIDTRPQPQEDADRDGDARAFDAERGRLHRRSPRTRHCSSRRSSTRPTSTSTSGDAAARRHRRQRGH